MSKLYLINIFGEKEVIQTFKETCEECGVKAEISRNDIGNYCLQLDWIKISPMLEKRFETLHEALEDCPDKPYKYVEVCEDNTVVEVSNYSDDEPWTMLVVTPPAEFQGMVPVNE